ncbi:MAG: polyamine aminopropyltransferase [Clostridia bacterium]
MTDLWYSEFHAEDVKFSIKVSRHLYSEKTPFQRIDFFESRTFGRFFTLDGLMMLTEKDEFAYHDMIVHPAFATRPDIRKVLIIGGGDGGTAREVSRYPSVDIIDMVEIDERVVRLCQEYLPVTSSILDKDSRIRLYFEDGLEFVKRAEKGSYDLILVDSTDPIGPGEGLFTTDFYRNCHRVLNDRGILINQHESPFYEAYQKEMKRARGKIKSVFPIAKVYGFHVPTYPSGFWLFGFASKELDPLKDHRLEEWLDFGLDVQGAFQRRCRASSEAEKR